MGDQIAVFDGDAAIFVRPESQEDLIRYDEFGRWPPELVPARASALILHYFADERHLRLAKQVTLAISRTYPCLVDTTFGEIYTSQAFARRCELEPKWDLTPGVTDRANGTAPAVYQPTWPPRAVRPAVAHR